MTESVKQLVKELFDYAGLFPPAELGMGPACSEFTRQTNGEFASAVARFVVPASRAEEFSAAAAALMPGTYATSGYLEHLGSGDPWRVSMLVRPGQIEEGLAAVRAFNERHATEAQGLAKCDTVEILVPRPGTPEHAAAGAHGGEFVDAVQEDLPDDVFAFFEVDHASDPRGVLTAISGTGTAAKIRTGGTEPGKTPTAEQVASFLHACAAAEVPFKCTAGLHHALPGERPITYADDAPRDFQHGFLNVFLAACLIHDGSLSPEHTALLLETADPAAMTFSDEGIAWDGPERYTVGIAEIMAARSRFAMSIGSCSVAEPAAELRELGLA
ncbi:MAG: hypothetical protein AAF108_00340 [Planctomycetota bacterium]